MRIAPDQLVRTADLAATFLFAVEGAAVGAVAGLDVFGVLVVSFATALGGGIVRDLLIGDVPPAALRSVVYPVTAFAGGALVILAHRAVAAIPPEVLVVLDAAGLALFCVNGAVKALDHRMNALLAVLLGTITAVGGGVLRDVMLDHVPAVLRVDIYAVAAAAGAAAAVAALRLGLPRPASMATGAAVCLALRLVSHWLGWNLPQVER